LIHYLWAFLFGNSAEQSAPVSEPRQGSARNAARRNSLVGLSMAAKASPDLVTRARELFGDYATLYVRGLGHVDVFVERYAEGERGELIVFFFHPITKILRSDGVVLDGQADRNAAGQE
jgi:hypothetical protein